MPSQVRRVPNVMSDGNPPPEAKKFPEATEFNDPRCDWSRYQKPIKPTAMNDGCARISVGACRMIWQELGLRGSIPSAFQARVNGAKGVWIRSGPIDTTSQEHLDVWIEISASQEKFEPHDEDTDKNFDHNRWTFEVLKATHSLKSNNLNVAFIPILEDRGVQHSDLQSFIKGIMDAQRHELITSAKDPVMLRSWVHKHMVSDSDRISGKLGNLDNQWQGGLPFARVDRVMYLLEAGFTPSELPILGDLVEKIAKQHFSIAVASFRVQLPRSTIVMGIADPTGLLQPGEIQLMFTSPIINDISGECFPFLDNKEVLVARHPSLRHSDIQKVRAVYRPELAYLTDVVVFPRTGCFPLASKLQGGDYDGDTFWVCWEPALTKDFKNAPAPLPDQLPKPEDLGITVDRRKLSELLSSPNPVKRFLSESFKFRFQPEILGRCTNLHKRLSYRENSLVSGGVDELADLHGYLIDAPKNGYIFGEKKFGEYVKKVAKLSKPSLPQKGYEEAMSVGFDDESQTVKAPDDLVHILDILYFDLMEPEIRAALQELKDICKSSNTTGVDKALAEPYEYEQANADDQIRQELRELEVAFQNIYFKHWNPTMHPPARGLLDGNRTQGGQDRWVAALNKCYPMYKDLKPKNLDHPIIKRWMLRVGQGPSTWDLIKASALYTKFSYNTRTPSKAMFAWNMAGQHLMYIKAHNDPNFRPITAEMLKAMNPRKVTAMAKDREEGNGSPAISFSLGEKVLNDLTQDEDDYASEGDDFSSAADFLDDA
jgi:hypothetical protein